MVHLGTKVQHGMIPGNAIFVKILGFDENGCPRPYNPCMDMHVMPTFGWFWWWINGELVVIYKYTSRMDPMGTWLKQVVYSITPNSWVSSWKWCVFVKRKAGVAQWCDFLSRFAEDLGDELKCEVRGWNHKVGSFFPQFFQLFLPPKDARSSTKNGPISTATGRRKTRIWNGLVTWRQESFGAIV